MTKGKVACLKKNHRILDGRTLQVGKLKPRNVRWPDQGHTNGWIKSKTEAIVSASQSRGISPVSESMSEKEIARIFKEKIDGTWQMFRWGERNKEFPVVSRMFELMWLGKRYHQPGQIRVKTQKVSLLHIRACDLNCLTFWNRKSLKTERVSLVSILLWPNPTSKTKHTFTHII